MRITRQGRWLDLEWLPKGELQSDALRDLQTEDNKLSVYKVDGVEDTERVVTALAANRKYLANIDYATFEATDLASTGIAMCQQEGCTPDTKVNRQHYDLSNLTVSKLAQLADIVASGEHVRKPMKEIGNRVGQGIRTGTLDKNKIESQLLEKLKA